MTKEYILSDQQLWDIAIRKASGDTWELITQEFKLSEPTIRNLMIERNIPQYAIDSYIKYERNKLIIKERNTGKSYPVLSGLFGLAPATISAIVNKPKHTAYPKPQPPEGIKFNKVSLYIKQEVKVAEKAVKASKKNNKVFGEFNIPVVAALIEPRKHKKYKPSLGLQTNYQRAREAYK